MAKTRNTKFYVKWHGKLAWLGGIALLAFALSGLLHPVMVWTGPQAKAFFPPQTALQSGQVENVAVILETHQINQANIVKVIASKGGPVLQVTEPGAAATEQPRRYFDLESKQELVNYEIEHATWLGEYYTGLSSDDIASIEIKNTFDNEYPWVNRLLPVYRIAYESDDNLVAFVFTETNALASLSNDWKRAIQTIFGVLHTWNWLDDVENARVFLMALILICIAGLAITGTALVFTLKNRKIPDKNRHWHRKLAAYLLWLPLLGFTASGFYHLLQTSYGDNYRGLKLGQDLMIDVESLSHSADWVDRYPSVAFNGMSLVSNQDGQILYRLSLPKGRPGQTLPPNMRFDGTPIEKGSIYIDPLTGQELSYGDRLHAQSLVKQFFNVDDAKILDTQLITRFSMHYDFRNKRLPVWMFHLDTVEGDRVFVDPESGVLVDRLVDSQRYEGYFFSFLHKWNFLRPIVGREVRDVLTVLVMLATLGFGVLGVRLKLKKRKATEVNDNLPKVPLSPELS